MAKIENAPITAEKTPEADVFLLKSKGLQEQFSNQEAAKRSYGKLKKEKISEGGSFKIELLKKSASSKEWETVDMIKVSDEE